MKKFAVAVALFTALPLFAADADQQQKGEEKELAELLSIVQQETDVATKTRNASIRTACAARFPATTPATSPT